MKALALALLAVSLMVFGGCSFRYTFPIYQSKIEATQPVYHGTDAHTNPNRSMIHYDVHVTP
jgi:hypothetical protein